MRGSVAGFRHGVPVYGCVLSSPLVPLGATVYDTALGPASGARSRYSKARGTTVGIWVRCLEVVILAQAGNAPAAPAGGDGGGGGGGIPFPFLALIVILGLGYMMIFRPERQKQKAFRDQIAALKKNDRIVTIGGIYGVVANIHREADKVTIKVDEQTKIDFTLGAISRVISGDSPTEPEKPATK
jgi:preprotein translocase subunit YajC